MKFSTNYTILMRQICLACGLLLLFAACKKNDSVETATLEELYPLRIGKFITYRVDSLVFTNSGKATETHRYRFKHIIEKQVKDNQNRTAWLVNTYINDSLGSGPWVTSGVYTITPLDKQLEINENNLRVIKLHLPAREGFNWRGNSYLPDRPYNPEFPISIDGNMSLWEFTFASINQKEKIGSADIENVTTITHIDESENIPIRSDTSFASRELSLEKYAKNIGLVYREFQLWENQPRPRTTGTAPNIITTYDPVRIGFGVKMWMVDRN
ncbi:MAG: hypothetical protein K2Q24_07575 [Chitinophagaceae bacterium]|jgi:hypothetical protein|nr:hypothetical protein [Chitinophagaceae bacterium]